MSKPKLLLVEDEQVLATVVKETLELNGYAVIHAANGKEGWQAFIDGSPDICVVDVMMPKKDGFTLVEEIRMVNKQIPVIFLTARNTAADAVRGLHAGADDYVRKPFSMEELMLRIQALLRRAQTAASPSNANGIYEIGSIRFDHTRLELRTADQLIRLSQREADILQLLAQHMNDVAPRKLILLNIWGDDGFFNARNMDVYITRIRKYLQPDPSVQIINVRGVGFKLIV